jgi:sirohydrochlorin cobaltochelatase
MARWLAWAIELEKVSVRRNGARLLLPAGPAYRIEQEVKNVVTAVAKTHHYWLEHLRG